MTPAEMLQRLNSAIRLQVCSQGVDSHMYLRAVPSKGTVQEPRFFPRSISVIFRLHSPPLGLRVLFNMSLVAAEAVSGHVPIREAEGVQVLETREMKYHRGACEVCPVCSGRALAR